ncbi:L-alanine-DL-glutamate epimerase [Amycolatopsis marina]|uniref:L-alanine-DL-glutamate epimerase n=1 Tax=Amycolatopsis marina TaxID=490629 RepID=A0A1I0Z5R0_9PSEU|nr:enolase C-terminal domain-like protein [Amycolatopsis marina]SFB19603.1 L-alanine-DL-glutamate epimerase [Amycolatopsis marina]
MIGSAIEDLTAAAYRIPTPGPEADGTLRWDGTTIVVVQVHCGDVTGLGWTYANEACVDLVRGVLADRLRGRDVLDTPACWHAMQRRVRNLGRVGLVSCAMSAVDIALWDAAARLREMPLCRLLGRVHDSVDVYGSGGFTTYDEARLTAQLENWVGDQGIPRVKIKIGEAWGNRVERDVARVAHTRKVAGANAEVYVDANGAYSAARAARVGELLAEWNVTWFEEPVSSDDLDGLRRVRDAVSADVAAGEYGYDLPYFRRMLDAGSVDCLQVDVTRCGGYTEWLRITALAAAANLDVSAHCAPNVSVPAAVATANFRHVEWFADHERIEPMLFTGTLSPDGGSVAPDLSAPGHGLAFSAEGRYRIR